jgi:hypothetical protein
VIEPRNLYNRGHWINQQFFFWGKPTLSCQWKAAVLGTIGRVSRTPPGSKSGACIQRDSLGTWESHLFPCEQPGNGVPGDQAGQALVQASLSASELEERTRTEGTNKVSVGERRVKVTEMGKWQS